MPKELEDLTKEQLIGIIKTQQDEADRLNDKKLKGCLMGAAPGALLSLSGHLYAGIPMAIAGCATVSGAVDAYDMVTNSRGARALEKTLQEAGNDIEKLTNPRHGLPEQQQPQKRQQGR